MATNIHLLISTQYFKDGTIVHENVDNTNGMKASIKIAQDIYIHPALGTDLYNKIVEDSSGGTITGNYLTLLTDLIQPCLKWYALYEFLLVHQFKVWNKSVGSKGSDNLTPLDWTSLQNIRNEYKDKAEWYKERLIRHLQEYDENYPEYTQNTDGDDIHPQKDAYTSPIYLGGGRKCGNLQSNFGINE